MKSNVNQCLDYNYVNIFTKSFIRLSFGWENKTLH